jgi:nitrate reductase (cytochrome), electron transfer subunit
MKQSAAIIGVIAIFTTACANSQTTGPVSDNDLGLSKTSVFDDPSPSVFEYPKTEPSAATALPRAWNSAPPQVPHKIDIFVPITTNKNMCVTCHDKPGMMGKKVKGIATAMPESHYNKVEERWVRANARFNCTQCHVPQAGVSDLVNNTFKTE